MNEFAFMRHSVRRAWRVAIGVAFCISACFSISAQQTGSAVTVGLAQYLPGRSPSIVVEEATDAHAEVVVFPEVYSNGYASFDPNDSAAFASAGEREQAEPIDYWMGHENENMASRYGQQLVRNRKFRSEWATKVGLGFDIPSTSVPKPGPFAIRAIQNRKRKTAA